MSQPSNREAIRDALKRQDDESVSKDVNYPIWYKDQKFWFKWYVNMFDEVMLVIYADNPPKGKKPSRPGKKLMKHCTGLKKSWGSFPDAYRFKQLEVADRLASLLETKQIVTTTFVVGSCDQLTEEVLLKNEGR